MEILSVRDTKLHTGSGKQRTQQTQQTIRTSNLHQGEGREVPEFRVPHGVWVGIFTGSWEPFSIRHHLFPDWSAWGILPWMDSFPSASHYVTVVPGGRQSQKHGAALLKEASPCLMDQPYRPFSLFYKLSQQYPIGTKQVFWTAVPDPMSLMTKDLITPLRDMNS